MKNRIVFWVFMLALLPLAGRLMAQSPLRVYECETLPVKAHTFSANAKVFKDFNDGDSIFRLWLKPDGTTEQMEPVNRESYPYPVPAAKTGNASLPDGFYFGRKQVKYFGLTGGGLVYFGVEDELHPTYEVIVSVLEDNTVLKFYTALAPTPISSSPTKEIGVLASTNTSVEYEIAADTLFVAYNNVKLLDTGNRAFVLSFQYAFIKGGEVRFIPVAMQPQGDPNEAGAQNVFYFNYGLFTGKAWSQGRYLKDLNGTVASNNFDNIKITKQTYPNQTYRMYPGSPCVAVENPEATFSFTAASEYIEFNNTYTTWNKGTNCLLILSKEETLTGNNLPVNGVEYKTGSQIGSSLYVINGTYTGNTYWLANKSEDRTAKGLTPGTTYYVHAFPYNTECAGFVYNTSIIPSRAITTAIQPVKSVSVDAASVTENGFTLNIDMSGVERYVLAMSRRQMNPLVKASLSSGVNYKVGDKLSFSYSNNGSVENYKLEIVAVGTEEKFTMTDAKPNSDYYYYIWSADNDMAKFSFEYTTCGVSTPYYVPTVLSFDSAAEAMVDVVPAGWDLPSIENRAFRVKGEFGQKYLSVELYPYNNDASKPLQLTAVSPLLKGGKVVAVSVDFHFWKRTMGVENAKTLLRKGDMVQIQYKKITEDNWTTVATLTSDNIKTSDTIITTQPFFSLEDFNLRFVAVSTEAYDESAGFANAAIRKIEVASVCNAISSEPEVSQIMHDRVTLKWEDENNTPRAEAYYLRCRASENDAWIGQIANSRDYTFKGLKENTNYTMQVASICYSDTSDYVEVSFSTVHGFPYKFALASKEGSSTPDTLPEGVTVKVGALPAGGAALLDDPVMETVWAPMQKTTNVYGAAITSGANPIWLKLPVVSTGVFRGKARLSLKLSAWSDADATQAAIFGTTDTLWLLFSTDNKFNRTNAKSKINLSELTPQGKSFAIDFDVENPYQYWALYTNLSTAGNVIFLDSLNIEWTEMYCDAATSLHQSNLSYYSVDLSWKGEGVEYAIIYTNRDTKKRDTAYTRENTCKLDKLESNTPYEYYILVYCDAERQKVSGMSTIRYFQTEKVCEVPTIELIPGSETWQGVGVITHSNEQSRQFQVEAKDQEKYPGLRYNGSNSNRDTIQLKGLTDVHAITYRIRARSLCFRDSSDWSEYKEFTTLEPPACGDPTGLKASVNVETQTATLSWKPGENNNSYVVFVRARGIVRRDTIPTNYPLITINNIVADAVYSWSVMAACETPLYSKEVAGDQFGLNVGVESVQSFDKALKLRVFESQIIIENNEGFYIKSLQAFSTDGKLLKTYPVNSDQNVYIYHSLPKGAALLRVLGENGKTATYKTIIL